MMIAMRNIYCSFWLLCAVSSFIPAYAIDARLYSEKDVRLNVGSYLDEVFHDEDEITLSQYYYYDGTHDEKEFYFELLECKERWNESYRLENGKIYMNDNCMQWSSARSWQPDKFISLYYHNLKRNINAALHGVNERPFEIVRLSPPVSDNEPWIIDVSDVNKKMIIRLFHASNKSMTDIYLCKIILINGVDVLKWLGVRAEDFRKQEMRNGTE